MKHLFLTAFLIVVAGYTAGADILPVGIGKVTYGGHKKHRIETGNSRTTTQTDALHKPNHHPEKRVAAR